MDKAGNPNSRIEHRLDARPACSSVTPMSRFTPFVYPVVAMLALASAVVAHG